MLKKNNWMGYKQIILEWKRSRLDKKKKLSLKGRWYTTAPIYALHITNTCHAFLDCMPRIKRGSVSGPKPLMENSNLNACSIKGLRPPPPLEKEIVNLGESAVRQTCTFQGPLSEKNSWFAYEMGTEQLTIFISFSLYDMYLS